MKKLIFGILVAIFALFQAQAAFAVVGGANELSLSWDADPSWTNGYNDDPFLCDGMATSDNYFNLSINNHTSSLLSDATLSLAIPYATTAGSWSVKIGSNSYTWSDFSNTGFHSVFPANIYGNNKSRWMDLVLGDISGVSSLTNLIEIKDAPDDYMLHFSAYGSFADGSIAWIRPSHDAVAVTQTPNIPEPISSTLFLLGSGALALRARRRKK